MPTKKQSKIKLRTLLIALAGGVVLAGVTFAARGWIRGPFVQWYAETVYLKRINHFFEADFTPIDPKLAELQLTFDKRETGYSPEGGGCNEPMYELLGVQTHCYRAYYNDNPGPTTNDAYRERWRQESPALERYLLAEGWTKTWNAAQPIDELLIRDDRGASVGVNYVKQHGKVGCELSIWYNGSVVEQEREFNARKSCSRNVEFFGGY